VRVATCRACHRSTCWQESIRSIRSMALVRSAKTANLPHVRRSRVRRRRHEQKWDWHTCSEKALGEVLEKALEKVSERV
jgi:hypothetical protein